MKKYVLVLLICLISYFSIPKNTIAQLSFPQNVRRTGIKTTIETITLKDDEKITYDLDLVGNQEAKVKLEILDPIYTDPEKRPVRNFLDRYIADPNIFSIHGQVLFDVLNNKYRLYQSNGKEKRTIGEESLIFDRTSLPQAPLEKTVITNKYTAGGNEGRIDEFYIRKTPFNKNDNSKQKVYLSFHAILSYVTVLPHPPDSSLRFRFKITIEKSGNDFLATRCKYLKFLPSFLYNPLTGNKCDSLFIANENVNIANLDDQGTVNNDPNCSTPHNESKKYSIAEASRYLGDLLSKGKNDWYNKFKCSDPQNPQIPQKARDVYSMADPEDYKSGKKTDYKACRGAKSCNWNPKAWPDDHIECVAFVFMSYNMAGNPITKIGKTNGKNMIEDKYTGVNGQFTKYKNGDSNTLPQNGDVFVWTDGEAGHVGIVSKIDNDFKQILMYNSNSPLVKYRFRYKKDHNSITVIRDQGGESRSVPNYWLHKR